MADREYKVKVSFEGETEVIVWLFDDDEFDEDEIKQEAAEMVEHGLTFADGNLKQVVANSFEIEPVKPIKRKAPDG